MTVIASTFENLRGIMQGALPQVDTSKPGATPEFVTELQTKLRDQEFYSGEITGEVDKKTRDALAAFKRFWWLQFPTMVGQTTASRLLGY